MFGKGIISDVHYFFRHGPGLRQMHGTLEEENPGGSTITVTTAGTYYGWTTSEVYHVQGVTADFTGTSDGLVPDDGGNFLMVGAVSFRGTPNSTIECGIFVDDVQEHVAFRRKLGAGGDVGAAPIATCLTGIDGGDKIDVRFTANSNGDTVIIENLHWSIVKIYE